MGTEIKIKVAEALAQNEIGKNIARIDTESMAELGLNDGDLIEIIGSKSTASIAVHSQSEIGRIIRIDGTTRKNSGASIGDEVIIKKASAKEAKKVVLAPTQNRLRINGDVNSLFRNRVMVQGDIITTGFGAPRVPRGLLGERFPNMGNIPALTQLN